MNKERTRFPKRRSPIREVLQKEKEREAEEEARFQDRAAGLLGLDLDGEEEPEYDDPASEAEALDPRWNDRKEGEL